MCEYKDCKRASSFNYDDQTIPLWCKIHADPGMIDIRHEKCELCKKRPNFAFPTQIKASRCKDHIIDGMINILSKKCELCAKNPSFGFPKETKALRCKDHIIDGMINVSNKKCQYEFGCSRAPTYGEVGSSKRRFCLEHSPEEYVDVKKRNLCKECRKRASFNFLGEKIPLYCSEDKLDGMINITRKPCEHDKCIKEPIFNFPGEKIGIYCLEHLKTGMVDIRHRKCTDCKTRASFCNIGDKTPTKCKMHKDSSMINLNIKKCIGKDDMGKECTIYPSFNYRSEKTRLYCKEHSLDGMVNLNKIKDRCSKTCKEVPMYGYPNKRPESCIKHKADTMIDLIAENECSEEDCTNPHDHIYEDTKYCNDHLPSDSHLLTVKRICKYCDIREESEYICNDCKKVLHKKEWAVVRHLRKEIKTPFEYDTSRPLQGCSKRRPDIFFDLPSHCVIVEIDEDQHKGYLELCECSRMAEIVSGIGGRSVIFIRYNPDKVRSCGEIVDVTPAEKIDLLVKTIKKELRANYEEFTVKLVQIYYDDDWDDYAPLKEDDITHDVAI